MSDRSASIAFHGGAGSVTGANFLLDTNPEASAEAIRTRILVDCGLQQGSAEAQEQNHEPFPYDPKHIDALVVTHAHIDHIGRIPKLVRDGFRGPIFSTPPTKDLAAHMFEDALDLMERQEREQGTPVLYGQRDIQQAFAQWQTKQYHEVFTLPDDVSIRFLDAGHILGSAMVECTRGGRVLVFSGDLGNSPSRLLRDTEHLTGVNYLLMESVYGDRNHENRDARRTALRGIVEENRSRGGVLLIPAFSIQRTQVMLYELNAMIEDGEIDPADVYLDSPLAIKVTEVHQQYQEYFNNEVQERLKHDENVFSFPHLSLTPHRRDSQAIEKAPNPKIVIAGSGMSHGGRIRAHEKRYLDDKNATLLFVGYQTPGSLGRRIQDGASRVRIDDTWVSVRAHIETIQGFSAHKDRDRLVDFVADTADSLEQVFVAMGEPRSSLFLAQRLRDFLDVPAVVPEAGDVCTIAW